MFLPSLSGIHYIEYINKCLSRQRFTGATAKNTVMALKGHWKEDLLRPQEVSAQSSLEILSMIPGLP